MKKHGQNFTLIELMMVIIMISMTVFLVSQNQGRSLLKSKLKNSAHEIVLASKYARLLAIESQQAVKLHFDTGKKSLSVIKSSQQGLRQLTKDPLFKMKNLDEMVEFENFQVQSFSENSNTSPALDQYLITYLPDGRCDKATIILRAQDFYISIFTQPFNGSVKVVDGLARNTTEVVDLDAI